MPIPHTPTAVSPIGDGAPAVTFHYAIAHADAGTIDFYDIGVSTEPTFAGGGDMWNGTVQSAALPPDGFDQVYVTYAGAALTTGVNYYWRVRVTDNGWVSPWSTTLAFTLDPEAVPDVYDDWAQAILNRLSGGVDVTVLGTLIPEGAQVAELVTAEYRSVIHVVDSYHGEPIDRYVELLGASWSLDRDNGWTVDLVTQDLPG